MKKIIIILAIFSFSLCGCAKKKHTQAIIEYQRQASRYVANNAITPSVKQAGSDLVDLSNELQAWHGKPKTLIEYTPENVVVAVLQSKEDRENPWWKKLFNLFTGGIMETVIGFVSTFWPQLGMFVSVITGAWAVIKKWKADRKVMAGYQSIQNILKAFKRGEIKDLTSIKRLAIDAQNAWNVMPDVKKDLMRLYNQGILTKVPTPEIIAFAPGPDPIPK